MDTTTTYPAGPKKWYEIWMEVWSHPGVETFRSILKEPDANSSRGLTWVAATGFLAYLVSMILSLIFSNGSQTNSLLVAMITAPIGAMVGIAISSGIYHVVAKLFGGEGTWGELVFCSAIIQAPFLILSGLASSFGILHLSGLVSIFSLILSLYMLVMYVSAINAVENIGTGKSIATLFIPVVVGVILILCVASGIYTTIR